MAVEDRKIKEKQQRHDSILSAAEELIHADGLHSLNMDLIAKKTELAKGTLYLYFKSKEEILGALSVKARNMLLEHFQNSTKQIEKPVEQLKAIALATFSFYKKYPIYYDLIAIYEANNRLEETEEIENSINRIFHFVLGITEKGKEDGSLNPKLNPVLFSFCMWGMVIGMSQLIKVRSSVTTHSNRFTEADIIETFMFHLEAGLKK